MLSANEQAVLLRLARQALEARVHGRAAPPRVRGGPFGEPRGAFVTLHCGGDLRGCLGRIDAAAPLADTIRDLAAVVADSDARFTPVAVAELTDIDVEISVLTPQREIASIAEIEIGRHGLVVERGRLRGLLLPQVAVEHGWDAATFLTHACLKAGLPGDAWRGDVRMLVFEAQVFSERASAASP